MAKTATKPKSTPPKKKPVLKVVKAKPKPKKPADPLDLDFRKLLEEFEAVSGAECELEQKESDVFSTGCFTLDCGLSRIDPVHGNGGYAARNAIEIYGPPGAGKTTMLWLLIRSVQRRGKLAAILFSEEPDWKLAKKLGVDVDKLIVFNCYSPRKKKVYKGTGKNRKEVKWDAEKMMTAEEGLPRLARVSKNPNVGLIAVDSVKGCVSTAQVYVKGDAVKKKERSFHEREMAARANFMEKLFNRLKFNHSAVIVMVNHSSQPIQMGGANTPERYDGTSGGGRKEFEAIFRIRVSSKPIPCEDKHEIFGYKGSPGLIFKFRIQKGRWGGRGRRIIANYYFDKCGFDDVEQVLPMAAMLSDRPEANLKLVRKSGNFWYFPQYKEGKKGLNGIKRAAKFLELNPKIVEDWKKKILFDTIEGSGELWKVRGKKKKSGKDISKALDSLEDFDDDEEDEDDADDEDIDDDESDDEDDDGDDEEGDDEDEDDEEDEDED